ncbi:hypothetical protein DLB11_24525 [Salmonella enterica subsp. enterica serovar Kentucky]|nr:hypothetical protein [Salmonella enterica subsp. enterica serovar Kentucky]
MALHSAMRKTVNLYADKNIMDCTLGHTDNQYAIMVKNPFTGEDCIYSGQYLESNLLPATKRSEMKGYITRHRAERDIATIFLPGQNARVVTMEEAEIFLGSRFKV